MRLGKRLIAASAVASALCLCRLPAPAAASDLSATGESTISFTSQGEPVSCTVKATSRWIYPIYLIDGNKTQLVGDTFVDADTSDPECFDLLVWTGVSLTWTRVGSGRFERVSTTSFASSAELVALPDGPVKGFEALHFASFRCDPGDPAGEDDECPTYFTTSPK
jgi:hypothetical protein